jgi:predicted Zn-dependent protease
MGQGWIRRAIAASILVLVAGCAVETADRSTPGSEGRGEPTTRQLDPREAERLKRVMLPVIRNMNNPLSSDQVKIGIIDSSDINAANAGPAEFYVTTGLLQRANDEQLLGVMAHEVAHADLGHVSKTQALGTGLSIGVIILDQIIPGSNAITPLAGELVLKAYTRKEEYQADAHGVTILRKAGYDGKRVMENTLTWLLRTSGAGSGGFFSTHPGTEDRIEEIRKL